MDSEAQQEQEAEQQATAQQQQQTQAPSAVVLLPLLSLPSRLLALQRRSHSSSRCSLQLSAALQQETAG